MKTYITIAEAAQITDKHTDTIRAFCKKYPEKTKKDKTGKLLVSRKAVMEKYELEESDETEQKNYTEEKTWENNEKLIEMLKDQLDFVRQQNEELRKENSKNTEMIAELFRQQQVMNGYMLQLQAQNERPEPKKKHWWSRG